MNKAKDKINETDEPLVQETLTPHDEWDYDGVNEMILADIKVKGKMTPALVHFDRNGYGYTMNRINGALLVAEKYDPAVNWSTHVDMKTGYPQTVNKYSTHYTSIVIYQSSHQQL